jgi:hypothetical protein
MRRAEVEVVTDLMGMDGAQMSIARLSAGATVVALEAARCFAARYRAAGRALPRTGADDS